MTSWERTQLERFGLSVEAIAKTAEVLQVWEVEEILVTCSYCRKLCINPDVRKRQYRRKTPPTELFLKVPVGFRDKVCAVICWPCDEDQFQS